MAPVGRYVKALFLGLVSKSKCNCWRQSSKSRGAKRRQVFDVGDFSHELEKRPPSSTDRGGAADDEFLGVIGGIGMLSTVYWGQLPDGSQIAVKRLDTKRMKGMQEFALEARILGNVCHRNVLRLRGFCAEGRERMLVCDFMANMSLHGHLHGSLSSGVVLEWSRRMNIAIGAAEGLAHLHHQAAEHFVHGQIKSGNVLLDSNFEAKWADFGLMRLMQEGCFHTGDSKEISGYLPPEYIKGQGPSKSGDVFGFGILLLELISGRKPSEKIGSKEARKSMWEWAEPLIVEGKYSDIVDPSLEGHYTRDALNLVVYVATMCAQSNPCSRLTMIEAAELLKCGNGYGQFQ